ncbi:MAG: AAA family ATPase [Muribaculaceae bacterium]|nr:AAA family ATPase [Muribaculaceae bacterium]
MPEISVENNIIECVKTYLENDHTGALMISGPWGCGKTFFIKNFLLKEIQKIKFLIPAKEETLLKKLKNKAVGIIVKQDSYYPVLISAFGIKDVKDLEVAIVSKWFENVSQGTTSYLKKLKENSKKLSNISKKLKDIIDFSELLNYKPGISAISENSVIIIDDLERISSKIPINEVLGFINQLVENKHFKVIIIANEEHLKRVKENESDLLEIYKEKVVEKSVAYTPDIKQIYLSLIGEDENRFLQFMKDEKTVKMVLSTFPYRLNKSERVQGLTNLRTLKFAINQLKGISKELESKLDDLPGEVSKEEIKINCWNSILALSVELKEGHIDSTNDRDLGKVQYGFLDKFEADLSFGEEKDNNTENEEISNYSYCQDFFNHYFKINKEEILPILSRQLVDYTLKGAKINFDAYIKDYISEKERLCPKEDNSPDKLLNQLMWNFTALSNDNIVKNFGILLCALEKGEFRDPISYINAFVLISPYSNIMSTEKLLDRSKAGVNKWFQKNEINDNIISRLQMINSEVKGEAKELYDYMYQYIRNVKQINKEEHFIELIEIFKRSVSDFATAVGPQKIGFDNVYNVPETMTSPILANIPLEVIEEKIKNIQPFDVKGLQTLWDSRYNQDFAPNLFKEERCFWNNLLRMSGLIIDNKTPGQILFNRILKPKLEKF